MGCIVPVIFLIGGALIGGPIGAVIGLLLSIAITLSAAKSGSSPLVTPHSAIAAGAILAVALVVWTVASLGHRIHDATHPNEVAARVAAAEQRNAARAVAEAKARQQELEQSASDERHKRLMHECMGDNATLLPPAAFAQMRKLCEGEIALKESGSTIRIPEIQEQRRIDAEAARLEAARDQAPPLHTAGDN